MTLTTEQLRARAAAYRTDAATLAEMGDKESSQRLNESANAFDELAANREAQPVLYASEETLAYAKEGEKSLVTWSEPMGDAVIPLYTAPPAPAVPDGYCVMPLTLTAANGAKGALSGEFKVSRTVRCHECGGEGCDDCADAGEFEEEITVPWDTIKDIYRAAVDACRAAMLAAAPAVNSAPDFEAWFVEKYKQPERLVKNEDGTYKFAGVQMAFSAWVDGRAAMLAQPVSGGYKLPEGWKLVPVEPTEEMLRAAFREASVYSPAAYRAMLGAAPESGK
ncbi:Uncharacterised protein [Serratia marcescens]|uniref:hypothetical protein n=1 Tax=Serratia marcescens TaxID=615 RepID=UPI00074544F1|nr:hypothetical protein [Serratia marcescens]CVG60416.1 Uncharacterised protein [Serratia marcescens]